MFQAGIMRKGCPHGCGFIEMARCRSGSEAILCNACRRLREGGEGVVAKGFGALRQGGRGHGRVAKLHGVFAAARAKLTRRPHVGPHRKGSVVVDVVVVVVVVVVSLRRQNQVQVNTRSSLKATLHPANQPSPRVALCQTCHCRLRPRLLVGCLIDKVGIHTGRAALLRHGFWKDSCRAMFHHYSHMQHEHGASDIRCFEHPGTQGSLAPGIAIIITNLVSDAMTCTTNTSPQSQA
jgi:hypothetical protein